MERRRRRRRKRRRRRRCKMTPIGLFISLLSINGLSLID